MLASTAPAAMPLDHSEENATTSLYRAAIGLVNVDFYLPIFTRFEAANRISPSWNGAASLYTLNWLLFRQLWLAAGVYCSLVLGVAFVWFRWPDALDVNFIVMLGVLSVLVPGLYGNALLHRACRRRMAHALSVNTTLAQACSMLQREASSRRHFIWLALLNGVVLCAAVAAYLLWPVSGLMPQLAPKTVEVRNLAAGRVSEASPVPASMTSAAVPTPVEPASAPLAISAPAVPASAPVPEPVVAAAAAELSASAPVAVVPPIPVIPASAPAPVQTLHKEAAQAPLTPERAPKTSHHFAINVGLFAKDANAKKVHTQLRAAGLPVYTQVLHTSKGKLTRVRVGPFKSQKAADAAVVKIHALKLDAVVFEQ